MNKRNQEIVNKNLTIIYKIITPEQKVDRQQIALQSQLQLQV
jgi:hypothetical protein